jgi:hypothetical protein
MEHIKEAIGLAVNAVAVKLYGMTRTEAWNKGRCIRCKGKINEGRIKTEAGSKEYNRSAVCEICFNEIVDNITEE